MAPRLLVVPEMLCPEQLQRPCACWASDAPSVLPRNFSIFSYTGCLLCRIGSHSSHLWQLLLNLQLVRWHLTRGDLVTDQDILLQHLGVC